MDYNGHLFIFEIGKFDVKSSGKWSDLVQGKRKFQILFIVKNR